MRYSPCSKAFTLLELLIVLAVISVLACTLAPVVGRLGRSLAWKATYIGQFHNARIASAVEERFGQIDMQLEDGSFQAVLKWK